jgi:uncharacterized protein (DUF305 family)
MLVGGCGASATIGTDPSAVPSPGSGPSSSLPSAAVHNDADVAFASLVVTLHRRAVADAAPAAARAVDPRVRALAADVTATDEPEIDSLASYLDAWGAPIPPEEATAPHEQPGSAVDRTFLDAVRGGTPAVVAAARREQSAGRYEPARELAGILVREQTDRAARARALQS